MWVLVNKEEDDCLEKALWSDFAVFANKVQEGLLIGSPVLNDASLGVEHTADEEVVLVVRCDVEEELSAAHFSHQVFYCRTFILDDLVDVFDCLVYTPK